MLQNPLEQINMLLNEISQNITREMNRQFKLLKEAPIEIVSVEPMIGKIEVHKKETKISFALVYTMRVKK